VYKLVTALAVVGTLGLGERVSAESITLDIALERAAHRPSVESSRLGIDEARANARGAALPLYNPELSGGAGAQFGSGAVALQAQVGLQQTLERGGKRAARVRLADAEAHGAELANRGELLRARVEAWRAFERALVLRDRLETRRRVEALARALVTALQQSAAAGGATKLRVNLVVADAGRATQERIAADTELAAARARLATAIGATPQEVLEPSGAVADVPALAEPIDALIARALRAHPTVLASDNRVAEATARVADADARGVTDVTIGVDYAYDPDPDGAHAVIGTIAFPLALRNRNQGARAAARVGVKRAELERTYARAEVERAVRLAAESFERARTAVAAFDREVTERLGDNLAAAQDAFAKGGLDFVELTMTQRELIASRIAYLDARLALIDAWADLALVAGMEVQP
jgi:cobalt-zinc-cadmium efflux system outer membrane protein